MSRQNLKTNKTDSQSLGLGLGLVKLTWFQRMQASASMSGIGLWLGMLQPQDFDCPGLNQASQNLVVGAVLMHGWA